MCCFVGGLFEPEFEGQKLAFTNAIEKINLRSDILPKTLLIYDVQEVQYQDSFHASKKGKYHHLNLKDINAYMWNIIK